MNYKKLSFTISILIIGLFSMALTSGALTDNLNAYWSFDSINSSVRTIYDSVAGFNFTYNTTCAFSSGILGNAFVGDGIGCYANNSVNPQRLHLGVGNFTITSWIYRNDADAGTGGTGFLIDFGMQGTVQNGSMIGADFQSGNITLYKGGTTPVLQENNTIPTQRWNFYALTRNDTGFYLYKNNTLQTTAAFNNFNASASNTWINLLRREGNGALENFSLDEIGVWSRSLSSTEISQLWNNGVGLSPVGTQSQTVTLTSPINGTAFTQSSMNFTGTYSSSINMKNATYLIYNSTSLTNRTTVTVTGNTTNSTTQLISNIAFGTYLWNILLCSDNATGTVCSLASQNSSFTRRSFSIDSSTFTTPIYDTDNSTFIINITVDSSTNLFSASLNYSGRSYPADFITLISPTQYSISRKIDIPLVMSNTTRFFNWIINFQDSSGFTSELSDTFNQSVAMTNITTSGTQTLFLNILDEDTLTNVSANVFASFQWHLGGGTETKNSSVKNAKGNQSLYFINPGFETFYTDINLNVFNATGYNERVFDFDTFILNSSSKYQPLYLLSIGNGTNVIIELRNSGLAPLEDYLVKIYRWYPGDGLFRLVESRKTDIFGQLTARLIEDSVRYKIEFYDSNNTLVKTANNVYVACRTSICTQQFIIEDQSDFFGGFGNLTDYAYSFSFNNNTNTFIFSWQDNTGEASTSRLEVVRYLLNGTSYVCNSNSTAMIGILSCAVGDQKASYQANIYRTVGIVSKRISTINNVKVGDLSSIFGFEGLIWSFFLLFTLILIGAYYPPVGVALYLGGFFLLGILDIIYINPAIIVAEFVIGIIFIWSFRS